jgi:hypothetical protein
MTFGTFPIKENYLLSISIQTKNVVYKQYNEIELNSAVNRTIMLIL